MHIYNLNEAFSLREEMHFCAFVSLLLLLKLKIIGPQEWNGPILFLIYSLVPILQPFGIPLFWTIATSYSTFFKPHHLEKHDGNMSQKQA